VIYHVFANRSNAGDWLSARGIQSLLAPWPVTECLCDAPFVPETLAILEGAGPGDLVIIGGGGLFMDYFVPFWEGFRRIGSRVPYVIWGAGCCDMKREPTRPPLALVQEIAGRAQLCVVRDELTRSLLAPVRLPTPVPCPTLVAVPPRPPPPRRMLLHVDHLDNVGPELYERMLRTATAYAADTGRRHAQTNNLLPAGSEAALERILELYAGADLVLTSRLHGCIIALAMGRRVLAVSADHKVESFMDAAGLGEWVCGLDEGDRLPARLAELEEQVIPHRFVDEGRRLNREVADRVKALLGGGQPSP
jgi:polysaccharide pyruvyl transferase WcaK-like protein